MDETTSALLLVPAPGSEPEFLAKVEPLARCNGDDGSPAPPPRLPLPLPPTVVLSGYTRDEWAVEAAAGTASPHPPSQSPDGSCPCPCSPPWKSAWLRSVDGQRHLPGFLRYLRERRKVSFGRFEPPSTGAGAEAAAADGSGGGRGVLVVPFDQPVPPEDALGDGDDVVFCRFVTDERRIGRGYRVPAGGGERHRRRQPSCSRRTLDGAAAAADVPHSQSEFASAAARVGDAPSSAAALPAQGSWIGTTAPAKKRPRSTDCPPSLRQSVSSSFFIVPSAPAGTEPPPPPSTAAAAEATCVDASAPDRSPECRPTAENSWTPRPEKRPKTVGTGAGTGSGAAAASEVRLPVPAELSKLSRFPLGCHVLYDGSKRSGSGSESSKIVTAGVVAGIFLVPVGPALVPGSTYDVFYDVAIEEGGEHRTDSGDGGPIRKVSVSEKDLQFAPRCPVLVSPAVVPLVPPHEGDASEEGGGGRWASGTVLSSFHAFGATEESYMIALVGGGAGGGAVGRLSGVPRDMVRYRVAAESPSSAEPTVVATPASAAATAVSASPSPSSLGNATSGGETTSESPNQPRAGLGPSLGLDSPLTPTDISAANWKQNTSRPLCPEDKDVTPPICEGPKDKLLSDTVVRRIFIPDCIDFDNVKATFIGPENSINKRMVENLRVDIHVFGGGMAFPEDGKLSDGFGGGANPQPHILLRGSQTKVDAAARVAIHLLVAQAYQGTDTDGLRRELNSALAGDTVAGETNSSAKQRKDQDSPSKVMPPLSQPETSDRLQSCSKPIIAKRVEKGSTTAIDLPHVSDVASIKGLIALDGRVESMRKTKGCSVSVEEKGNKKGSKVSILVRGRKQSDINCTAKIVMGVITQSHLKFTKRSQPKYKKRTWSEYEFNCLACSEVEADLNLWSKHSKVCCPQVFNDMNRLEQKCYLDPKDKNKLACPSCGKEESSFAAFLFHAQASCPGILPTLRSTFSCPSCETRLPTWSHLRDHLKTCCPQMLTALYTVLTGSKEESVSGENATALELQYDCPSCYNTFSFEIFLEHLIACCPQVLRSTELDATKGTKWELEARDCNYVCLACGVRLEKLSAFNAHLITCCPSAHKKFKEMQKCYMAKTITAADIEKVRGYDCPGCQKRHPKWTPFMAHLKCCSPKTIVDLWVGEAAETEGLEGRVQRSERQAVQCQDWVCDAGLL